MLAFWDQISSNENLAKTCMMVEHLWLMVKKYQSLTREKHRSSVCHIVVEEEVRTEVIVVEN